MKMDAVLLDIDGTLVDSNEYHVTAWFRAFKEAGLDLAPANIRKQIGKGADMLIPALAPDLTDSKRESIAKRHGDIFKAEFLARVRPFAAAHELIRRLHEEGRKVVLASSADQKEVDHYVSLLGVGPMLAATTSADDVERSKPAADIFAMALKKSSVKSPERAIAVGDTPYDVAAAAKCGVRTIALRSGGFTDHELSSEDPVAVYDDAADLLANLSSAPL